MTTNERRQLLDRFADTDRWLTRVYDRGRTDAHRVSIWKFLMDVADPKLKQLLITTRRIDEAAFEFWQHWRN